MTITLNGTTGITTPDVSTTTETISGGTANGVQYLNGSKAVTTGSALTFDGTNLATTGSVSAPNTFGFKNRIINGNMMISQYNGTSSVTPTNASYPIDRWRAYLSQASKYSVQQNAGSVTPPVGFINYLGVTSLSAYSVGVSDIFSIQQFIEGFNVADLGWGTANAQTVTLSFRVYSSLTGTFGGVLQNDGQNRSYPFTYTISSANTWTTISITVAGDTSGTWLTTNGRGIAVWFGLGVGSSNSGTAGAWAAAGYYSATGAVSVVGINAATWYVTGVQLEKGTVATSFDFRDYGRELILCQRYYTKISSFVTNGQILSGFSVGATSAWCQVFTPVQFRALPTFNFLNLNVSDQVSYSLTVTSIAGSAQTSNGGSVAFNNSTGAVIYRPCAVNTSASTGYMDFSAEL
jgi:hypothetical protein